MASSATAASGTLVAARCAQRGIPFVAVNLEPVFGSIDAYLPTIEAAVSRLEAATGRAAAARRAHSMGGLAAARAGGLDQADHRICRTWSRSARRTTAPGWPDSDLRRNTRQMRQLCELAGSAGCAASRPQRRERFTCFYGHCDNIVVPAIDGDAAGRRQPPPGAAAHVQMAFRPSLIRGGAALAELPGGKGAGPNSRSPGSTTPASILGQLAHLAVDRREVRRRRLEQLLERVDDEVVGLVGVDLVAACASCAAGRRRRAAAPGWCTL